MQSNLVFFQAGNFPSHFVMWIHLQALHLSTFDYFRVPPLCSLPLSTFSSACSAVQFLLSYQLIPVTSWNVCVGMPFHSPLPPSKSVKMDHSLASYRIHAADFSPGFKDKGLYINILKYRAIKTPMCIWLHHHYALHQRTKYLDYSFSDTVDL